MRSKIIAFILVIFVTTIGIAYADTLGMNITIYDQNSSSSYTGTGIGLEDNETETNPNTIKAQVWDLEGFFLQGNALSMVGGYDFKNGYLSLMSGDIFFDITGDAKYGSTGSNKVPANIGTKGVQLNNLGWDFALRMNFSNYTYSVWEINANTQLIQIKDVPSSNPWKVYGSLSDPIATGSFTYSSTTSAAYEGLSLWTGTTGNKHYTVSGFDLGFLGHEQPFTSHYTYECGNDNLMGQGITTAPEPGTLALLGLGLTGLAGFARFSRKRK